MLANFLLVRNI
jgi:hypothetical protein